MCIINQIADYETSRLGCHNRNMNLFVVDTSIIHILFFNATTDVLSQFEGGHVWINGRYINATDTWIVQNSAGNQQGLLYAGLDWVNTETINGRTNGPCLLYTSAHGFYQGLGISCSMGSWFVCEHFQQFSTPDPTASTALPTTTTTSSFTTTTTAVGGGGPNVNACAQREDLFDNGIYLKSLCIMTGLLNYNNSEGICRSNGMELFVLDSSPIQNQFRASVTRLLSAHPRGFVWINGRMDDSCGNWYVFDPYRRHMWGGVHWVQTDNIHGRESGECLRFTAEHSINEPVWQSMGSDCSALTWYICEYFT
jgi:hypothetical protein